MKKNNTLSQFLFITISLLFIVSCEKPNTKQVVGGDNSKLEIITKRKSFYNVFEWEHKGHIYLLIERSNGAGITHAGHCSCRKD
jgi:hypothetical protein